jgi:hypothetical protein
MEKFILFQFNEHYPAGGLSDITGSFPTLELAKEKALKRESVADFYDYSYVVDRDTWEIVWEEGR